MTGEESAVVLVRVLDLVGTFAFALSGAALAVQRRMDLLGVLVLAFVTAVVGGMTRDLLIGAVPPIPIASWYSLALIVVAGLLAFRFSRLFQQLQQPVQVFDAAGLGTFTVAGTQKALDYGINWPMAAFLGMISGIGGGMVRTAGAPRGGGGGCVAERGGKGGPTHLYRSTGPARSSAGAFDKHQFIKGNQKRHTGWMGLKIAVTFKCQRTKGSGQDNECRFDPTRPTWCWHRHFTC
jgi:hypothetical protein